MEQLAQVVQAITGDMTLWGIITNILLLGILITLIVGIVHFW